MATVSVGLLTSDATTLPAVSAGWKSILEGYFPGTLHTFVVTAYQPSQLASLVSSEDVMLLHLEGVNKDGTEAYADVSAAFDLGVPVLAVGYSSAGATQFPALLCEGVGFEYQSGAAKNHVVGALDSTGILAAAGFDPDDPFQLTSDGDAVFIGGELAPDLEIMVETDSDDLPLFAILPQGGEGRGEEIVSNSIIWCGLREAGTMQVDSFNLIDACLNYLYAESQSGGPSPTEPDPPTGLTATADGHDAIDLSWSAPGDDGGESITGYMIEREVGIGNGWSTLVADTSSTSTTYEDSSVDPGQEYNYRVSAINSVGTGSASTADSATTDAIAPGTPTGLSATANGHDQIDLSWTAPASTGGAAITGYMIEREVGIGNGWSTLVADTASTATSYGDSSVAPETEYNYRVSAINSVGTGSASTADDATTSAAPAGLPGAPTGLTATADGDDAIDLAWTAPASDGGSAITGYVIGREVGVGGGWSALVADTEDTATTYRDSGLDPAQEYNYVVAALNAVGQGPPSNTYSATTDPEILAIGDISADLALDLDADWIHHIYIPLETGLALEAEVGVEAEVILDAGELSAGLSLDTDAEWNTVVTGLSATLAVEAEAELELLVPSPDPIEATLASVSVPPTVNPITAEGEAADAVLASLDIEPLVSDLEVGGSGWWDPDDDMIEESWSDG